MWSTGGLPVCVCLPTNCNISPLLPIMLIAHTAHTHIQEEVEALFSLAEETFKILSHSRKEVSFPHLVGNHRSCSSQWPSFNEFLHAK